MPTTANPFGLKAKHHPSGVVRPQRWVVPASDITANAASWGRLYQDDAVYIDTNGRLQVTQSPLAIGTSFCIGSFSGVEFNDSNGRRTVSNQFSASSVVGPSANTGLGTTDVWFWLYTDPTLIYEVQLAGPPSAAGGASASAFTPPSPNFAQIGNLIGYSQSTGQNSVTGFSTGFAFVPTGTVANCPFSVYNLAYDNQPTTTYAPGTPTSINGNSWADAYPNVLVTLANAQFNGVLPNF
jgi:hypothetical protein